MNFLMEVEGGGFAAFWSSISMSFANFGVRDIIDILLLALVFFVAISVIKGKKASMLILGIAICVAIYFLSYIFELRALHSVFSVIIESGAIVLVVIFQPEIREALEKIGKGSIDGIKGIGDKEKGIHNYTSIINSVCTAVATMSVDNVGALIIFERNTKLIGSISDYILIDALVNEKLIRNLFVNKSPLHDGAILISEGRIAAAKCILPLADGKDLGDYGTRHKAALGISEISDAVTIVVSEETGKIAITFEGQIIHNVSIDELKKFLYDKLARQEVKDKT